MERPAVDQARRTGCIDFDFIEVAGRVTQTVVHPQKTSTEGDETARQIQNLERRLCNQQQCHPTSRTGNNSTMFATLKGYNEDPVTIGQRQFQKLGHRRERSLESTGRFGFPRHGGRYPYRPTRNNLYHSNVPSRGWSWRTFY